MKINRTIIAVSTASILFTGCAGELSTLASNAENIMDTGTQAFNMVQSVEVSGARNKGFKNKDFTSLNSVAIKFSSSGDWWAKSGNAFADNVETQLMQIGLDTYKYSNTDTSFEVKKTQSVRSLAKSLKKENVQALVTGTVTASQKYATSFGSGEFKTSITEVSFSLVNTTNGKTMASINLNYKKGVSNIEASKDIAKALKALIDYPNMEISKAFEKIK